mgnify:CR=1 FL=1
MLKVENLEFGIKMLEDSIENHKYSINSWKECIINDLQSPTLDESTINTIESRVKKIQKLLNAIEKNEAKIRLIKQIING